MPRRTGFTIIEILVLLAIFLAATSIAFLAINPEKQLARARNERRRVDLELLADAIDQFTQDEGAALLLAIPKAPAAPRQICSDAQTGSCANLLSVNVLLGRYLSDIPVDPSSEDPDTFNEHSRYFIQRDAEDRFILTAPDTEFGESTMTVRR